MYTNDMNKPRKHSEIVRSKEEIGGKKFSIYNNFKTSKNPISSSNGTNGKIGATKFQSHVCKNKKIFSTTISTVACDAQSLLHEYKQLEEKTKEQSNKNLQLKFKIQKLENRNQVLQSYYDTNQHQNHNNNNSSLIMLLKQQIATQKRRTKELQDQRNKIARSLIYTRIQQDLVYAENLKQEISTLQNILKQNDVHNSTQKSLQQKLDGLQKNLLKIDKNNTNLEQNNIKLQKRIKSLKFLLSPDPQNQNNYQQQQSLKKMQNVINIAINKIKQSLKQSKELKKEIQILKQRKKNVGPEPLNCINNDNKHNIVVNKNRVFSKKNSHNFHQQLIQTLSTSLSTPMDQNHHHRHKRIQSSQMESTVITEIINHNNNYENEKLKGQNIYLQKQISVACDLTEKLRGEYAKLLKQKQKNQRRIKEKQNCENELINRQRKLVRITRSITIQQNKAGSEKQLPNSQPHSESYIIKPTSSNSNTITNNKQSPEQTSKYVQASRIITHPEQSQLSTINYLKLNYNDKQSQQIQKSTSLLNSQVIVEQAEDQIPILQIKQQQQEEEQLIIKQQQLSSQNASFSMKKSQKIPSSFVFSSGLV